MVLKLLKNWLVLVATLFVVSIPLVHYSQAIFSNKNTQTLKVAYPHQWVTPLHPSSQHTLVEDAIMLNVFESLVQRGGNGLVLPLAAKSFTFSKDFKTLNFQINTQKKFSNGDQLSSQDFKKSWEEAFSNTPNSSNSSLADIIIEIEGSEDFAKTGQLSGVKTPTPETLTISFKRPFRMALMHLTGARFAAFKKINDNYLGTGLFKFKTQSNNYIVLSKNDYSTETSEFSSIEAIHREDAQEALANGDIDIIAINGQVHEENENIGHSYGEENVGAWLHLNGKDGRFFAESKYRKAFQYLVWKALQNKKDELESKLGHFRLDFQPYLPFSLGRIENSEAEEIISQGKQYVEELIAESKKNPIKVCFIGNVKDFLFDTLTEQGLTLEDLKIPPTGMMEDYYKNHRADILVSVASVHLSDPDGLYHLLGKNGAIHSPMIYREKVSQLLEDGRSLTDQDAIAEHYQNLSRTIFEEVPGVHIGYRYSNYLYRKDRLNIESTVLDRHYDILWKIFKAK